MDEGTAGVDEWYHLPERGEVMVNVTDLGEQELRKVLAEIGECFTWAFSDFVATDVDGEVTSWLVLLEATVK